ncbi:hypothetical protein DFJ73DRAFT_783882 [Zopfochytrium polystomum]|nr:hypothetical protein DFJ73DRAFT_783882 [Zopfochytrium polystomum]
MIMQMRIECGGLANFTDASETTAAEEAEVVVDAGRVDRQDMSIQERMAAARVRKLASDSEESNDWAPPDADPASRDAIPAPLDAVPDMSHRPTPSLASQASSQAMLTGSSSDSTYTLIPPTNEELIGFMASQQRRWTEQERLNQQSRDKATYFTETLDKLRGKITDLENTIIAKDERIRALEEELERVRSVRRERRVDDDDDDDVETDANAPEPLFANNFCKGIKMITDPKVDTETKLKQIFRPRSSVVEARRAAPDYVPPAWSLEGANMRR